MSLTAHTEFTECKQKEQNVYFIRLRRIKQRFSSFFSVSSVSSPLQAGQASEFITPKAWFYERVRAIRSFTLVELMLVMGVIVILVAMLFPVIIGSKEKARKKQALTEAHNVVLALKAYRMEFDKWPNQTQAGHDTTYFTDNHLVIESLVGRNPRGKVFLAIQPLSTNISGGLTNLAGQTDYSGNFVDPWGVPYVICVNEDMGTNCLINITNVLYTNIFSVSSGPKSYSVTNYSVANVDAAVASFAGKTNANQAAFEVETWSEPR